MRKLGTTNISSSQWKESQSVGNFSDIPLHALTPYLTEELPHNPGIFYYDNLIPEAESCKKYDPWKSISAGKTSHLRWTWGISTGFIGFELEKQDWALGKKTWFALWVPEETLPGNRCVSLWTKSKAPFRMAYRPVGFLCLKWRRGQWALYHLTWTVLNATSNGLVPLLSSPLLSSCLLL